MFWLIQNVSQSASVGLQYAIVDYTIYVCINNFLVAILTEKQSLRVNKPNLDRCAELINQRIRHNGEPSQRIRKFTRESNI